MEPFVALGPGAQRNGFTSMLAQLVRDNLTERPAKKDTLRRMRGRVALVIEDLEMVVTLHFHDGGVTVYDDFHGIPDATVRTTSEWITKMSLIELEPRFGLPDPRGEVTREVAKASAAGSIRVRGALARAPLMLRLTKLLSVQG
jgi:hypothetical protein